VTNNGIADVDVRENECLNVISFYGNYIILGAKPQTHPDINSSCNDLGS